MQYLGSIAIFFARRLRDQCLLRAVNVAGALAVVMHKLLLCAGAISVVSVLGVTAAAPPAPAYSWNNCYLGGNIGYSWGRRRPIRRPRRFLSAPLTFQARHLRTPTTWMASSAAARSAAIGSPGPLGFWVSKPISNGRTKRAVSKRTIRSTLPAQPDTHAIGTTEIDPETGILWFGTVRGRLGYIWNNWLFYGTGGLAYGRLKYSAAGAGITESGNIVIPWRS